MSNDASLNEILADLAAGRIDATEAARRIEVVTRVVPSEPSAEAPTSEAPTSEPQEPREPQETRETPSGAAGRGAERVSVRSVGRRVRVIADPGVASVSVAGPHVLRRFGAVLEVTAEGQSNPLEGFSLLKLPRSVDELRTIGRGIELVVRVNPAFVVDAEVTASSLDTEGVPLLGRIRVTAGGASFKGVRQAADVLVQAGSATLEGTFSTGRSAVRCESGGMTVVLADGANVTVRGQAQMGKVNWPGEGIGAVDEWIVGNGSGRLDLEVVVGMITVKDESTPLVGEARAASTGSDSTCPSCHAPVNGGRFCPQCGATLSQECPGCGRRLPPRARFCPSCGASA